jgi:hypothetical protein
MFSTDDDMSHVDMGSDDDKDGHPATQEPATERKSIPMQHVRAMDVREVYQAAQGLLHTGFLVADLLTPAGVQQCRTLHDRNGAEFAAWALEAELASAMPILREYITLPRPRAWQESVYDPFGRCVSVGAIEVAAAGDTGRGRRGKPRRVLDPLAVSCPGQETFRVVVNVADEPLDFAFVPGSHVHVQPWLPRELDDDPEQQNSALATATVKPGQMLLFMRHMLHRHALPRSHCLCGDLRVRTTAAGPQGGSPDPRVFARTLLLRTFESPDPATRREVTLGGR